MANSSLKRILPFAFMGLAVLVVVAYFFVTGGRLWPVVARSSHAFPKSPGELLHLEFEAELEDLSGGGFRPELSGGTFVDSPLGKGLAFTAQTAGGLDCSILAPELVHPFTIEMVLIPSSTSSYRKLIDLDEQSDEGWYYSEQGLVNYPLEAFGEGGMLPNQLHYLAWVSASDGSVKVYFQGKLLGESRLFDRPPRNLIFFRDDLQTSSENFVGVVEALRISSVTRSERELSRTHERLERLAPRASKEAPEASEQAPRPIPLGLRAVRSSSTRGSGR